MQLPALKARVIWGGGGGGEMLPWDNFENSNPSEAKSYAFWYSVVLCTVNHSQLGSPWTIFTFDGLLMSKLY